MKQWFIAILITLIAAAGAATLHFSFSEKESTKRKPSSRNVEVLAPRIEHLRDTITAVGTLKARNDVVITSEESGRVVKLNFKSGDHVKKGQVLVQFDDRQIQASRTVIEAQLAEAKRQLDRANRLRKSNSISQSQVDELDTAVSVAEAELQSVRVRLDNSLIKAPFDGHIGLLDISVGAYLENGDQITTLDATDEMELAFSVPERFIGQLEINQDVIGISAAYPKTPFNGTLVELGVRVDALSRTLPVRALIDNKDERLRPGMYMSVALVLQEREALVVPEQAILILGADHFIYTVNAGVAQRNKVKLGTRDRGFVEVLEGLQPTDQVVVTGQDRLSSGNKVNIIEGGDPIPPLPVQANASASE